MAFTKCRMGHVYDDSKFSECPFCKSAEEEENMVNLDSEETAALESTVPDYDTLPQDDPPIQKRIMSDETIPDQTVPDKILEKDEESALIAQKRATVKKRIEGFLVTYSHNPYGDHYPLYLGKNSIGRNTNNDIVINDMAMSGDHAIILFRGNKTFIEDKLSVNGTFINDGEESIDRATLKDNDIIKMGKTVFKIKIIGEAPGKEN
ncbi:Forkhead-associated protein [Caldithrix abyssi DSM 13497]|uniref:FHA domain-containing protein n=1 Tax=Caldithrix abyssi DSM 13497 TaxID=880073 RepID=H1XNV9_CALAY|nr:FHA domain-containing protein [Caldithrix abyssi]APF19795.1 FHA domain-containing protein [Caldithrix abyssi DSM 13497]EHO39899.1 Forkhead-associated protein [Caldithrix abyssi DSM 13497]